MADPPEAAATPTAAPGQDALLATKLYLPRPQPGFVPRPRLVQALGQGLARGRVLVCAPAGFGKTSLLADWAGRDGRPVAWLGLDAGDNDPARFWRYAIAALERARPGLGGPLGPLLGPPAPRSFEGVVTTLVNELARRPGGDANRSQVLLVLDDYHLIDSPAVHESVAFLAENLPPGLLLVMSGRADPPLPLARLRARGQLAELRAADLRFTAQEAAALLAGAGRGLPDTAVAALTARTEGWAAGLQLAALSLRGQADPAGFVAAFSGSHRYVLDYLADEVLDGQTGAVRAFLLETSVLERLSGGLCDAVTGRGGSQALLEDIERAGLFLVPLDEVRGWWRYHQLFADLLRARLAREQPARVPELHRAAAAWSDDHDLGDDAVRHALAAGDPAWAAQLAERYVGTLLRRGEGATLRRWLSALPTGLLGGRPRLCVARAFIAVVGGQVEAAETLLDDAERAFAAADGPTLELRVGPTRGFLANSSAGIAFLRAELARLRGDAERAADWDRQALDELGDTDFYLQTLVSASLAVADWLRGRLGQAERGLAGVLAERRAAGEGYLVTRVCYDLGRVQRAQGNLEAALATYLHALGRSGEISGEPPHLGMAHVGAAEVLYERDELAAARDHAIRGVALCRQLAFTPPLAVGLAVLARIHQADGDAAAAAAAMAEAGRVELSPQVVPLLNPVPSQRARLLLAQGDVAAASRCVQQAGLSPDDEPDYPLEPGYLSFARVLLAQDRAGPALALLDRLLATAISQKGIGSLIEIQALRALALAARGDQARGFDALTEAVTLACPQGYPGIRRRGRSDARAADPARRRPAKAARSGLRHRARLPGCAGACLRSRSGSGSGGLRAASGAGHGHGAGPSRAADRARAGGAATAGGGPVQSAHRPRAGGGPGHGEEARDARPRQARGRQPHRGRRAGPAARPDPVTRV
jgi:LuxR family maltose regulon positive regulatory protein